MSLSFISTLQGVKIQCRTCVINFLRHLSFLLEFSYTGCIRYSTYISVINLSGQKVNMFPTTFLFHLPAKKKHNQSFLTLRNRQQYFRTHYFAWRVLFCTGNAYKKVEKLKSQYLSKYLAVFAHLLRN